MHALASIGAILANVRDNGQHNQGPQRKSHHSVVRYPQVG
jgi:hypothetical protein